VILLDSSALVEFYRPDGDPEVRAQVRQVIAADRAATNGIVQVELLAFARGEEAVRALRSDFRAVRWLELGRGQFDLAGEIGNRLRARGVTVPCTDLIIAASAISAGAALYHLDRHFEQIAALGDLDERRLSPPPA